MVSVILILIILLVPVISAAEENDILDLPWERISFSAGGFIGNVNSSLRYGLSGAGVEVDFEEVLGLDSSMFVYKSDFAWRFSDNLCHRMDISWHAINRDSSKVLENDIEFGDYFFPEGSKAKTTLNFDIIKGTYSYSYFQDDRFDLAASFGFYVMPISFEVISEIGQIKESSNLTAPLPVFGLRNEFAVTPKVHIKNSLDFFYVEYDKFRGGITDIQIAVEYRAFEHVGFGLGAESFLLKVKSRESSNYPGG